MADFSKKVHFSGLNELRALAALSVVFYHIESFKHREHKFSLYDVTFLKSFISHLGHNGVICFFVLSGFLITYLLLAEKQQSGTIKIKEFYIRRVLRIWPLYFLVILIGFVLMPLLIKIPFFQNQTFCPNLIANIDYLSVLWFLFFLSNFAMIFAKPIVAASQSWSVSVEEQFYLIWPLLIKNAGSMLKITLSIIIIFLIKVLFGFGIGYFLGKDFWLFGVLKVFQIEYMCVGAIGAVALFFAPEGKMIGIVKNNFFGLLVFVLLAVELLLYNHTLVLALLFLLLILFIVHLKKEIRWLGFLGAISYGIYMYHPLFNFIGFSVAQSLFPFSILKYNLVYYGFTVGCTILLSYLSFKYFESYFLKMKHNYTVIQSGA